MKTKRFIVGIVTTLLCAIAMVGVMKAPEVQPVEKGIESIYVVPNHAPGLIHQFYERAGAYDAANFVDR